MRPAFRTLLRWYAQHARDLPWRRTTDPYRIFCSEMMLQQTQVDRVIPLYKKFLRAFPSWRALAHAPADRVIRAWAGLGYNRRALYLREAAKHVVAFGVPHDERGWRSLKGVGPYAAAALTAFIDQKPAVVIDTNIRRVVGRMIFGIPHPSLPQDRRVRRVLSNNMPTTSKAIADLPQAFMDLGSTICTVASPACATCPLRRSCKAASRFLSGEKISRPRIMTNERRHRDKKYPDRIYRGRILAWIREHGSTPMTSLQKNIDPEYLGRLDHTWMRAMALRLAKDGLLILNSHDTLSLPYS